MTSRASRKIDHTPGYARPSRTTHHSVRRHTKESDERSHRTMSKAGGGNDHDDKVSHSTYSRQTIFESRKHAIRRSLEHPTKLNIAVGEPPKHEHREVLTYAETLHRCLKIMWRPMVLMGRLPFWLVLEDNKVHFKVKKRSYPYLASMVTCILCWILFFWNTVGIICLAGRLALKNPVLKNQITTQVAAYHALRFWMEVFIFWTTMLQACISTTHILWHSKRLAHFVVGWYNVLDMAKIEVSRTLKLYIIKSIVIFGLFILAIVVQYADYHHFTHMRAVSEVIIISLAEPLILIKEWKDDKTRYPDKQFYFQKASTLGLFIYIMAIVFSWLYIMQFMVFCRCFRKGLVGVNMRIAMVLRVDDVPAEGPNALRLTYELVHRDYLGVAITGLKIGKIFSWTMCNYYLWAILVLVVELGEIFKFAKKDFRRKFITKEDRIMKSAGFPETMDPAEEIVDCLMHFIVTSACLFYVSYEGAMAHKEGKRSYELARYKGLVDCETQLERNFVRSIWIVVSEKSPVHVSPGKFFGITNSTILTVFCTAITYFIFWVQSLGQLQHLGG